MEGEIFTERTRYEKSKEKNTRGDDSASKTRKTRKIRARKKDPDGENLPLLHVHGIPIQRSGSQSSLLNVQSAGSYENVVSVFSNALPDTVNYTNKVWREMANLHNEQARNIDDIRTEVQTMISSCNIQKNVNMPIKDGLKIINGLVDLIVKDHSLAKKKEIFYEKDLVMAEKRRRDRRQNRERAQAQVMLNVALAAKEAPKWKQSHTDESSPDTQTPKKPVPAIKRLKNGNNGSKTPAPKKATQRLRKNVPGPDKQVPLC